MASIGSLGAWAKEAVELARAAERLGSTDEAAKLFRIIEDFRAGTINTEAQIIGRLESAGLAGKYAVDAVALRALMPVAAEVKAAGGAVGTAVRAAEFLSRGRQLLIDRIVGPAKSVCADMVHGDWRATRRVVEGSERAMDGQPLRDARWKPVKPDQVGSLENISDRFKRVTDGKPEIDIANVPNSLLPPSHAAENSAAASGAIDLLKGAAESQSGEGNIVIRLKETASSVHEQWMARNGSWASKDAPQQMVPYLELSAADQAKDDQIVKNAVDAMNRVLAEEGQAIRFVIDPT